MEQEEWAESETSDLQVRYPLARVLRPFWDFGTSFKNGLMGDYGWSMDFDTPQGIDAVEYGRVLEYPKKRNKSQTTTRDTRLAL